MSDVGGTDILKRLRVLGLSAPIESVLACAWGREVKTEEDPGPCPEQAVRMTVLHTSPEDPDGILFKLCQRHFDYLATFTDPRTE